MTDPTPLAERIAREHYLTTHAKCACPDQIDAGRDAHAWVAHIATVTERAVREQIAEAIELYADAMWDLIESPNAARLALEEVTRIARGATP